MTTTDTPRTDAARTIADAAERAATFELIAMQCERDRAALRAALEGFIEWYEAERDDDYLDQMLGNARALLAKVQP